MKICNDTIAVLKNFSNINSNLKIEPGSVLKTIAPASVLLSIANVPETFSVECGIWDLKQFLNTLSSFNEPELDFRDQYVLITSGGTSVKYFYSDTSSFTKIPKKVLLPETQVTVNVSAETLKLLREVSSTLKFDLACFVANEEGIFLTSMDSKTADSTSNRFSHRLADNTNNLVFELRMELANMKFLDGAYNVEISCLKGMKFLHTTKPIEYVVALGADSTWNGETLKNQ